MLTPTPYPPGSFAWDNGGLGGRVEIVAIAGPGLREILPRHASRTTVVPTERLTFSRRDRRPFRSAGC